MAERNYPCDNMIEVYFGRAPAGYLDATGDVFIQPGELFVALDWRDLTPTSEDVWLWLESARAVKEGYRRRRERMEREVELQAQREAEELKCASCERFQKQLMHPVASGRLADALDVLLMDGKLQEHYRHSVPPEASKGPRVNLTFRWIEEHCLCCPGSRTQLPQTPSEPTHDMQGGGDTGSDLCAQSFLQDLSGLRSPDPGTLGTEVTGTGVGVHARQPCDEGGMEAHDERVSEPSSNPVTEGIDDVGAFQGEFSCPGLDREPGGANIGSRNASKSSSDRTGARRNRAAERRGRRATRQRHERVGRRRRVFWPPVDSRGSRVNSVPPAPPGRQESMGSRDRESNLSGAEQD